VSKKPLKKQQKALFEAAVDAIEAGDLSRLLAVLPGLQEHVLLNYPGVLLSETLLNHALDKRNDSAAEALIDAGADVNIGDYRKVTPLMHAAARGSSLTQKLLRTGASSLARDTFGRTALHHASGSGLAALDAIRILVEAGIDVNARENSGRTALHAAAGIINPEKIEALLSLGADPDVRADGELGSPSDVLAYVWALRPTNAASRDRCAALLKRLER